MPDVSSIPFAPKYHPPPATKEDLDWADLAVIDLSKMSTPEGRAELITTARDAMREIGFFYVINHGWSSEQTSRMLDIANIPFTSVSEEEKRKYAGKMLETGSYQGYKLRQYWHIDKGVHDQIEHYNINKDVTMKEHPEALRPFIPEINEFIKHNHFNVLHPILKLLALGINLPEDAFSSIHGYEADNETWMRMMTYFPRSAEDESKTNNVWLKGHTDVNGITILWSQPVSGLQIQTPSGKWKWIKHMENALVINVGDSIEFLSGGYYRATIHRVVQPPADQRGYPRVGLFYFALPDDNVRLFPSPGVTVVKGYNELGRIDFENPPTMEVLRKGRIAAYGKSKLDKGADEGTEVEYIAGVLIKHFN